MQVSSDFQGDPATEAELEARHAHIRHIDDPGATGPSHTARDNTERALSELQNDTEALSDEKRVDLSYRSGSKSPCEISTQPQPTSSKAIPRISSLPQETESCTVTVHGLYNGLKDHPAETLEVSEIAEDLSTRKNAIASDIGPTKISAPSEEKNATAETTHHKPLDATVEPTRSFVVGPAPSKIMSNIHDGTIIIAQDIELARDPQASGKHNMYPTDKGIVCFKERPMTVLKILDSFKDGRGV